MSTGVKCTCGEQSAATWCLCMMTERKETPQWPSWDAQECRVTMPAAETNSAVGRLHSRRGSELRSFERGQWMKTKQMFTKPSAVVIIFIPYVTQAMVLYILNSTQCCTPTVPQWKLGRKQWVLAYWRCNGATATKDCRSVPGAWGISRKVEAVLAATAAVAAVTRCAPFHLVIFNVSEQK